jgi:cyclohexadieny/prephenate dehydrogenase
VKPSSTAESSGPRFSRVAIIGLGLLGGSVALATRRAGIADRIVAAGRRRAPLELALERGVVDEIGEIEEMVPEADLVVLGTPVSSMPKVAEVAAPHLADGALITDVGSVKGMLVDQLLGVLPPRVNYIGAHPMAGSHLRGVEHARADLFDGACCVLTPHPDADDRARTLASAFWQALGSRVVEREAERHDSEVAWMSHLPHVLAFAFAASLEKSPQSAGELAGSGFADFSRIAQSDGELWGDILSANRKALAGPIQAFGDELKKLTEAIERADTEAQEQIISCGRERLVAVATSRSRVGAHDEN